VSKLISELAEMSRNRPTKLKELKEKGKKIVEYTGGFIPEELIYAAGAEPYLMCRGGEPEPPDTVLPYMLRFMNPYAKSQVGFYLLGEDPVTPITDLIVAQQTDCHLGRISELMEYLKLPVYKVGVPADWEKSLTREYYYKALCKLKTKLEELTGNKITDEKLEKSIVSANKINQALRKISELRKDDHPVIGGCDFIYLNHYSFFCDPEVTASKLEDLYKELKGKDGAFHKESPRILLAGHVIAVGDYVVTKLVEGSGAVIVNEMFDEGMRNYRWDTETEGDLIRNIEETNYLKRIPPSIFQPAWKYRFKRMQEIIKEYRVDGVVWYQLSYDEIYNLECSCLMKWMDEIKMPLLKLESSYEYSREATGPLATRIESFVESIKGRRRVG
jgi:benzoyl-CoA reductase/2-hydroxyglutaryl-CoA dehydratase subunit BcrC/BadD/HgdB